MRNRIVRLTARCGSLGAAALLGACLQSTAPQPSQLHLSGSWSYTGVQTAPLRETLTGTLSITRESGTGFQGRIDLVAENQAGQSRILGGLLSGAERSTDVIDFDASVETTPRRHVGQIVADTISGTWVGAAPDGTMSSGTFRAERMR